MPSAAWYRLSVHPDDSSDSGPVITEADFRPLLSCALSKDEIYATIRHKQTAA
jgi:hypothetical protein